MRIPCLILKLYVFIHFSYELFPLQHAKWYSLHTKTTEERNNFSWMNEWMNEWMNDLLIDWLLQDVQHACINNIEMREGIGLQGQQLIDCHWKSIEGRVGTKHLVFWSYNAPTFFFTKSIKEIFRVQVERHSPRPTMIHSQACRIITW